MSDDPWSDWYSVPELAPKLGMSTATLKRRLAQWSKVGGPILLGNGRGAEVQAEKIARPQGDEWRARVRASVLAQSAARAKAGADQPKPDSKEPPPLTTDQSAAQSFLRLVELERAERQRIAAENATLLERAIRAEAKAEAQEATITALSAAHDAQAALAADLAQRLAKAEDRLAARRWWWRFWGNA